jgi:hypothetical protein
MGLQRTRQQNHTIESIRDAMTDLREAYSNAGAREMVSLLFHEKDMSVSRYVICFSLTSCEFDQQSQECGHFILCRIRGRPCAPAESPLASAEAILGCWCE